MLGLRYLKNIVTLKLDQEKCTGCRLCTIVCPHRVFVMNSKKAEVFDRHACMECGACARNCPAGAIAVNVGVGCATAVINSKLKRTEAVCCSSESAQPSCSCSCK